MNGPVCLITGATGLVGSELLHALLNSRPDRRVIVLSRNPDKLSLVIHNPRITVVEGDITRVGLGLHSRSLKQIRKEANEIVHCAAETRFGLPIEQARATNTRGISNILKVARDCN